MGIFKKLPLACAAYVSNSMLEIAHMITSIVVLIGCYNSSNQYYGENTVKKQYTVT